VDELYPALADELRHARDLKSGVRLQQGAAQRKKDGLVPERLHLVEQRPRQLQAGHHGRESLWMEAEPLDELSLCSADPEAIHEVQHG
jgi:hypothetical protein